MKLFTSVPIAQIHINKIAVRWSLARGHRFGLQVGYFYGGDKGFIALKCAHLPPHTTTISTFGVHYVHYGQTLEGSKRKVILPCNDMSVRQTA